MGIVPYKNISIYLPGIDSESEFIHISTGYVEPVVIKDKKNYYALRVRDHKSFIKNIKYLVARRGYYAVNRSVLADSCSITDIVKAVYNVYDYDREYIQKNHVIDIIDAEKRGSLGQRDRALVKYRNRLFYLIVIKYADRSELPVGNTSHGNDAESQTSAS